MSKSGQKYRESYRKREVARQRKASQRFTNEQKPKEQRKAA